MSNVVFIVNIADPSKPGRSIPYQYCITSWKKWCDKYNHKLVILDQPVYPSHVMNANWHKLLVFDLLDNSQIAYDKILIADGDTMIHPDAPNVFDIATENLNVVRNYGSMDWVCRSYENYKQLLFPDISYSPLDYFNSGILIINKAHKPFYKQVLQYYLDNSAKIRSVQNNYKVGTDQPVLNFMARQCQVTIDFLGYEWNMQDMARFEILNDQLTFTKCGWIFHFNAIPGGDEARSQWITKTYQTLFT